MLTAVLGLAFAASQFAELHFMLDNLSNFPVHFAGAFLVCATLHFILRDRRFALVSAAGFVISLVPVVPWYFAGAPEMPASDAKPVEILVSNVRVQNRKHARLLRLIDEEQPDVVALVEVNSRWLRETATLRDTHPYHFGIPDEAFAGLALYSRLPLSNVRVLDVGSTRTPAIAATLATPDGDIELILAHPASPLDAPNVRRRNEHLHALGRYVGKLDRPVVLAGDLNLTMWNRGYREFAKTGGLRNARAGHGVGPTWPAVHFLGVPIDHVVATASVRFQDFRVLENVGSDHLPISVEFSLR